jgi:hypothetical protein
MERIVFEVRGSTVLAFIFKTEYKQFLYMFKIVLSMQYDFDVQILLIQWGTGARNKHETSIVSIESSEGKKIMSLVEEKYVFTEKSFQ